MSAKTSYPLLLAFAGVLGCGAEPREPTGTCVLPVGDSPVRGPADAWVTMVEFSDFQCPFCARAVPTLDALAAAYPRDLRLVFKHYPLDFHDRALAAAIAAQCAHAQRRFWEMHDVLFARQPSFDDAELELYAGSAGVDLPTWNTCRADPATRARVAADEALAAQALVTGTPIFFVNGRRLNGALPYADFRAAVEGAIAVAEASGVERADYYASLSSYGCAVHPAR